MIPEVLVIGVRDADVAAGARFAVDHPEMRGVADAAERAERDAFQDREHRCIEADAEREDAHDGQREQRVLRKRAQRIADVARLIVQRLEPRRRPHAPRRFGRQRDVAEILERREPRGVRIDAVRDAIAGSHLRGASGFRFRNPPRRAAAETDG